MAITIFQTPKRAIAAWNKNYISAQSTQASQEAFKFVVRVTISTELTPESIYYLDANAQDSMTFDIAQPVQKWVRALPKNQNNNNSIHAQVAAINIGEILINGFPMQNYPYAGYVAMTVDIREGYNVDGVFTIDDSSIQIVYPSDQIGSQVFSVFNFYDFGIKNGTYPDLLATIGHQEGDQSRLMSDRLPTTYDWPAARFVGLSQPNAIYIPVREADYGCFDYIGYEPAIQLTAVSKLRLSILPNSGPPVQQVYDLGETAFSHLYVYPANLNGSTLPGILKPSDYPNWKAIYFSLEDGGGSQLSMSYVMFNVEHPQFGECSCHHYEVVRLAWIGRRGGWEYYNFNMLSETEYETDQKVAKKVIGNPGAVSYSDGINFEYFGFDESEFVTYKKINKFVTCNTDILQPGEWEFLKGLILSKQVHWVHDDGTHTPVIIQDSNFKVRNPKSKAREALTVRFKVAQDQSN